MDAFMKFWECFRRASPLLTSKNNLIILQKEKIINNTKSFSGEGGKSVLY